MGIGQPTYDRRQHVTGPADWGGSSLDGADDAGAVEPVSEPELGVPFGIHPAYFETGVLFPTNHEQADLDKTTRDFYDTWKSLYLKPACKPGQYLVKSSPATDQWTVSEGHGYGMVITAIMAGHDHDAHLIFNGLYAYYDEHRSTGSPDLMAWAQDSSCNNADGADSATDGDMDIAYALLLADKQWGSDGAINYLAEGKRIIAAILAADIHPADTILVGDWATSDDNHYTGTRPSDFMVSHFKAYERATGIARWTNVVDKTYTLVNRLQITYSPTTGLLPDFVVQASSTKPKPAPANWLEGDDDGNYAWNACRTPWRLATDYLMAGEARAQAAVRKMNAWIRAKTGGRPAQIRDGYKLTGTALGTSAELAFVAPFGVAAMVEGESDSNQAWLNALWDEIAGRAPVDYFGDTLKLQALIVMSGNWWTP
jgi:endo-1,4-beta-D-glucanase Y